MKALQILILTRILAETKKPGAIRAFFIGLIFPEFQKILDGLSQISETVESPEKFASTLRKAVPLSDRAKAAEAALKPESAVTMRDLRKHYD